MSKPKASIIILTYNNLAYTRMCLDSLYANTNGLEFELIVVDNASQDETALFLREFSKTHSNLNVILNDVNEGFARGNNIGATAAKGEVLVFLNNDIVVTQGWLTGLLRHLDIPGVGMVGPVTNSSGNESRIAVDYQDLKEMPAFAERYTREHSGQTFEISMLPWQCVALRRGVYNEVGPLDERFGVGMFEDDDYALRLKQKGYKIICAEDVFVHHWGSASFSQLDRRGYWRLFKQNLHKYEEKWRVKWLPHAQREELIAEQFREILDGSIWLNDLADDLETRLESKNYELNSLYSSNGWALLQFLLRIRRWFVPEGSQRERVFKIAIDAVRHFKPSRVLSVFREAAYLLTRQEEVALTKPLSSQLQTSNGENESSGFANRFPWPLVSVILPVYNQADLLKEAAWSVLNGTYTNLELIILDDGSSDRVEPVLQRLLNNPRVRVYRQPNQKLPRALTHAHHYAQGELITWTSADNMLAPNAIERLVKEILAHPEAVLVYADVSLIDEDGKPLKDETYRPQNQDPSRRELLRLYQNADPLGYEVDNYINACFLYRREAALALEGRFADDLRGLEDYDFWLRLQKAGGFYHIRNEEPLYYYRVHRRTMSNEILSQPNERDSHIKRAQRFIGYEAQRRKYCTLRWDIMLDASLTEVEKRFLLDSCESLPVNIYMDGKEIYSNTKRLRFVGNELEVDDSIYARAYAGKWQLIWRSSCGELEKLSLWSGVTIHPLALKARNYHMTAPAYAKAGDRPVVGCHMAFAEEGFDRGGMRKMVAENTGVYFVIADMYGRDDPSLGAAIVEGLENAIYVGTKSFGEDYRFYASLDALWIPPVEIKDFEHAYRSTLALAYAAGRPLIAPMNLDFIPAPYQYIYHPPDESLDFVRTFRRSEMNFDLLDRYLSQWKPAARLQQLIKYADAVTQEMFVPRPDFGIRPPEIEVPTRWSPRILLDNPPLKCGLVVENLDKGGLEELVAQLAVHLPQLGVQSFVLCTNSGGTVADRIKGQGVKVYVANGEQYVMRDVLRKEKPHIVNSHLARLDFLEVAIDTGLPVIETIAGSYIWLDKGGWELEKRRSRYFSWAVAVSVLTRNYYSKWNETFSPAWISIVPNAIDLQRVSLGDRRAARESFGIGKNEFLFLMLAAYDAVKNQLGVLTAFDELVRQYPQARLLCAGHKLKPAYFDQVREYRETLKSRANIQLYDYRQDISSLLASADAFVVNSYSEGWSLAATEALLAGVPLIHSECGSAWELIGAAGERGILVPNPITAPINLNREIIQTVIDQKRQRNTRQLVTAMAQLIDEREKWEDKRPDIREYALQEFNIGKVVKQYKEAMLNVLQRHESLA